jgi:hypothetical protein
MSHLSLFLIHFFILYFVFFVQCSSLLCSAICYALCSVLSALCSLLSALCSLLCTLVSALCSLLSAFCSLLSALCSLLSALLLSALYSTLLFSSLLSALCSALFFSSLHTHSLSHTHTRSRTRSYKLFKARMRKRQTLLVPGAGSWPLVLAPQLFVPAPQFTVCRASFGAFSLEVRGQRDPRTKNIFYIHFPWFGLFLYPYSGFGNICISMQRYFWMCLRYVC